MIDLERVEDLAADLANADAKLRKGFTMPDDMMNPAQIAGRLAGLARQASSLANAILIIMANERDRELLTARLNKEISK